MPAWVANKQERLAKIRAAKAALEAEARASTPPDVPAPKTQRNFTETIRSGRHMGRGREILPPMPIEPIRNFTDDDLRSIFQYLRTLPPIRNKVPEPLPPAGAN